MAIQTMTGSLGLPVFFFGALTEHDRRVTLLSYSPVTLAAMIQSSEFNF